MKVTFADVATAVIVSGLAALGGAFAVYAGYDDSPGGVLIGLLLIIGSVALGVWRAPRRP